MIKNHHLIALSFGIVYLWFGSLKFFPQWSPAETFATQTIKILTFDYLKNPLSIKILGLWETTIGLLFILNWFRKLTIILTLIHMALTFTTLFLLPEQIFNKIPFQLTFVGQYVIKNLIYIAALITLYKHPSTSIP